MTTPTGPDDKREQETCDHVQHSIANIETGQAVCQRCGLRWQWRAPQQPSASDSPLIAVHDATACRTPSDEARAAAVEAVARERLAAVLELHTAHLCSCGGRRWVGDENWSPRDYERGREREEGAGLLPCGFCNHGGWNTEQWDKDGAVSCDECDQEWPCPTALAAGGAR